MQNKGLGTCYNGIDLSQTHDYIKVSCKSFIDCMLQTHGWNQPSPNEKDCHDITPISSESINKLQQKGHIKGSTDHKWIEQEASFGYCRSLVNLSMHTSSAKSTLVMQ